MSARTLLVMAGGTGGHVYPALAVAQSLAGRGWHIAWLGTRAGIEARVVPQAGYQTEWLSFSGVRGKGLLRLALLPAALVVACWQALAAIRRIRPDVVLGMGGFAAFPGGLMASLLGRPLAIHEQNAVAGLANRVLAGLADRVLAAFPDPFASRRGAGALLPRPSRVEQVGNPLRADFLVVPAPEQRLAGREGPLRLLVVGGSLGAQALNDALPAALALLPQAERPQVVHQAGAGRAEALAQRYRELGVDAQVVPFIEDMAARYAWCDLVICRAGAMTVAEIAAVGVASVLVPYPHAVDDHQTGNARYLADAGAALLVPQTELEPRRLAQGIGRLGRPQLLEMARRARALARPQATELVARACEELAEGAR